MKNLCRLFALIALTSTLLMGAPLQAGQDRFAAIAYSPSSGRWGYGNGYESRGEATNRALRECGHSDARTMWARNSWAALAISDTNRGGYGWAWAATAAKARAMARRECLKRNEDARVVICVSAYR